MTGHKRWWEMGTKILAEVQIFAEVQIIAKVQILAMVQILAIVQILPKVQILTKVHILAEVQSVILCTTPMPQTSKNIWASESLGLSTVSPIRYNMYR